MTTSKRYSIRFLLLTLAAISLIAFDVDYAQARARFGTMCQSDFQNGWCNTLPNVWNHCASFNNELDDTDTKVFYYNLHGAKWTWEQGGDSNFLDGVNLFYANTHGGGWSDKSVWAMWNDGVTADSIKMRLGDNNFGLSILATYACETLKFDDGKMWTRMGPIFRGGLRIAVGSHDKVYDSTTTDEVGEDFADNLQGSNTIKYSWKDAVSDWYVDNDATIMSTGKDKADCENRRDNMKWQNYSSGYPRLRDNQIGWYCYWYWNNL